MRVELKNLERADKVIAELARRIDASRTDDKMLWVLKRQTSVMDLLLTEVQGLRKEISKNSQD